MEIVVQKKSDTFIRIRFHVWINLFSDEETVGLIKLQYRLTRKESKPRITMLQWTDKSVINICNKTFSENDTKTTTIMVSGGILEVQNYHTDVISCDGSKILSNVDGAMLRVVQLDGHTATLSEEFAFHYRIIKGEKRTKEGYREDAR